MKFLNLDIAEKILAKLANYKKIIILLCKPPNMATKFESSVALGEYTPDQFIMLLYNIFQKLGWRQGAIDDNSIKAETGINASSWDEEVSVTINGSEATIVSKCTAPQITDWGKNKKNVNKLLEHIEAARNEYTPAQLDEQRSALQAEAEKALAELNERYEQGRLTASDKLALGLGGYYVTYTLIGLNLLIFVAMLFGGVSIISPTGEDILNWGGNMRAYTASGEWWRLISCVFVHIGIIHLLFNMYALYSVGIYLEPIIGRWRFLAAYLSTGVLASVTSLWWSADRVSAGASGAIFGMYGFFLALLTTNYLDKEARQGMLKSILVFVVFNLVYGLKAGIDNAAHVGGLLSGFVFGYIFYLMERKGKTSLFMAAAAAITLLVTIPVLKDKNDDSAKFTKVWDRFAVLEEKALQPLKDRDKLSSADFIQKAERISMPAFMEIKTMLAETQNYNLPPAAMDRRNLLQQYTNLRIEHTQLWIKAEKEQNGTYYRQMESITKEIEKIIDAVSKLQ